MIQARLAHGIPVGESWVREVSLRELNGHDEEFLYSTWGLPAFSRATALLERLAGSGGEPVSLARASVGDITSMALQLRRAIFGEQLECIVACPNCGSEMSVDLAARKLLQKGQSEPESSCEAAVGGFSLKLRAMTPADLESLREEQEKGVGDIDPQELLVRSCIVSSEPALPERLDAGLLSQIGDKLGELDPLADLTLDLVCPECNRRLEVPFYPEDFLLREIDAREQQFEREVHWLAFNYHWSEEGILSLPMRKRKKYVELINATLAGESV